MISVTLYSREDCHLCEQAKADLDALQTEFPHALTIVNIDGNRDLLLAYGLEIPVVEAGPYRLKAPITPQQLRMTLGAATDRARQLENIQRAEAAGQYNVAWPVTKADRFSYWLAKHYMAVFNILVAVYLGLPFLAPVLMSSGAELPARLIYRAYGTMCHQLAFRSWFFFGEQPAYPRQAARLLSKHGIETLKSFGQATGLDESDILSARDFVGNSQLGYKVALCQRDVAIYGGILLFGLLFTLTRRRIKSLHWIWWILIGTVPIGIDGISQIISQPPFTDIFQLTLLPYRESTPLLRTITGFLFGLTTAWLGYPAVEDSMRETRQYMEKKLRWGNR
jgi:uncharacterized membrane protein